MKKKKKKKKLKPLMVWNWKGKKIQIHIKINSVVHQPLKLETYSPNNYYKDIIYLYLYSSRYPWNTWNVTTNNLESEIQIFLRQNKENNSSEFQSIALFFISYTFKCKLYCHRSLNRCLFLFGWHQVIKE